MRKSGGEGKIQTEGAACARVLGQDRAWHVRGTARPERLEQAE